MTSHERFTRMFEHREADRIPIIDSPWGATIERWQREGLPADTDFVDYFDLDHVSAIGVDNSPRYPVRVIEENAEQKTYTSRWGVTQREWKHAASTPEFLDFTVVDPDSWAKAKGLMTPTPDRVNWDYLKANYATWRKEGHWIRGNFFFGFDVTHSWIVGTERVLMAMIEQPEWMMDMFNHELDVTLALMDQVWDAGYTFDSIYWWEDMGYKYNQFFSLKMYREMVKPVEKRAVEWAHRHGIKAHLHSCGDINPFVPELIEIGVDALNPLEVKAGMDTLELKKKFGRQLVLNGGINAVLWDQPEAIEAEIRAKVPTLKEGGGFIFSSDHSVPSTVSLEDFRRIIELAKKLGTYA